MTDLWHDFGFDNPNRDERAALLGQAVADPTKHTAEEVALGKLLADILSYESLNIANQARLLLADCRNDYDGLRRMIVAMRQEGRLLWVRRKAFRIYGLRQILAEEYAAQHQAEDDRTRMETTEGRKDRYITEGVVW